MSVESEERIAENTIEGNSAGTVKIASDVVATIAGLRYCRHERRRGRRYR